MNKKPLFFLFLLFIGYVVTIFFFQDYTYLYNRPFGKSDVDRYLAMFGLYNEYVEYMIVPHYYIDDSIHYGWFCFTEGLIYLTGVDYSTGINLFNALFTWFFIPFGLFFVFYCYFENINKSLFGVILYLCGTYYFYIFTILGIFAQFISYYFLLISFGIFILYKKYHRFIYLILSILISLISIFYHPYSLLFVLLIYFVGFIHSKYNYIIVFIGFIIVNVYWLNFTIFCKDLTSVPIFMQLFIFTNPVFILFSIFYFLTKFNFTWVDELFIYCFCITPISHNARALPFFQVLIIIYFIKFFEYNAFISKHKLYIIFLIFTGILYFDYIIDFGLNQMINEMDKLQDNRFLDSKNFILLLKGEI